MIIKTKILKIKGDWKEILNDCRVTVGKEFLDKEPSEKFKKTILIAEHSPIRNISIKWEWRDIKSWIATHFSRHKWECFIKSQRSDRTGVCRDELSQSTLVDFVGEANIQALIDTMRKRLCYQSSPETRKYAEDLKREIKKVQPEIADVLQPNCIYRCGCPEMSTCKWFENFLDKAESEGVNICDITERYELSNKIFFSNGTTTK